MLNRFSPLSVIHTFSNCIWSFEGTSYKNLQDAATISFIFCCFMLDFISADTIFHYFLELHTALYEKKILVTNFPPHAFNDQNPLSVKKVFSWCSLLPKGLIFDYACQAPPSPLLKSATPHPLLLLGSPPYYCYRLLFLWKKSDFSFNLKNIKVFHPSTPFPPRYLLKVLLNS